MGISLVGPTNLRRMIKSRFRELPFQLNKDLEGVRDLTRRFAQKELTPAVIREMEQDKFPEALFKKAGEIGLFGLKYPPEIGGSDLGLFALALSIFEIAKISPAFALVVNVHGALATNCIFLGGNQSQIKRYLPPAIAGEKIVAFALTEPGAGSDALGSMRTLATKVEGGYRLDGQKLFITEGRVSHTLVVFAKTDLKNPKSVTAFIVENPSEGLSFGKDEEKLGMRGTITSPVFFENVFVPEENRIGDEGFGAEILKRDLPDGRILVAAIALGIQATCLEGSLGHALTRVQMEKALANFAPIRMKLSKMLRNYMTSWFWVRQAVDLLEQGEDYTHEANLAKVIASRAATQAGLNAIQIHGGSGYIQGLPYERLMRDAKLCEIGEGANEALEEYSLEILLRGLAGEVPEQKYL